MISNNSYSKFNIIAGEVQRHNLHVGDFLNVVMHKKCSSNAPTHNINKGCSSRSNEPHFHKNRMNILFIKNFLVNIS